MFVRLFRDSFETPWGFRLQGGKDIGHALTVQRVFSNSPAEGELQRGDVILSINGRDANTFTHKQALDTIKFGGGQIELKVNRPAPGSFSIKTIQPSSPTRAPQISPIKTSPLKFPVRRASDHSPRDMPPPAVAGFQPKKITMNKFGGGTTSFGSTYGARAQQPGWVPQPSPYSEQYTPQPSMQEQYGSNYNQQYQPQQYQPPSPQYQAPPPQFQAPPPQFQPPSPQPEPYLPKYQSPGLSQPDYVRSEDPVDEEEYDYVPVSQRKQQFADKKGAPAGDYYVSDADEAYYPNCPVWERRKMFMRDQPKAIKSRKAKPFVPHGGGGQSFGTDYSKTRPHPPPQPPVVQQRPRPPPVTQRPVNAAPVPPVTFDQPDTSSSSTVWSGTLRSSGGPRPWEQENAAGEYIMPSQRETLQQSAPGRPGPAVSPKPTRPPPQPLPKPSQAPTQAPPSPQKQIIVRSEPSSGDIQDGPKAVHLQYNSPMGLYSNANVQEAYSVQTSGQDVDPTSSTVSKPKSPQPGIAHAGRFHCPNIVYSKEMIDPNPRTHSLATDFSYERSMHPSPIVDPLTGHYVPHYQMQMFQYEVDTTSREYTPAYRPVKPPVPFFVAKDDPSLPVVKNETNNKPEVGTNITKHTAEDVESNQEAGTEKLSDAKSKNAASMAKAESSNSSKTEVKDAPLTDDVKLAEDKSTEQAGDKQTLAQTTDAKSSKEIGVDESSKTNKENEKESLETENVPEEKSPVDEKPGDKIVEVKSTEDNVPDENKVSTEEKPECQGNEASVSKELAEESKSTDTKKDAHIDNEKTEPKSLDVNQSETKKPASSETIKDASDQNDTKEPTSTDAKNEASETKEPTGTDANKDNFLQNDCKEPDSTDTTKDAALEEETTEPTSTENKKDAVLENDISISDTKESTTSENNTSTPNVLEETEEKLSQDVPDGSVPSTEAKDPGTIEKHEKSETPVENKPESKSDEEKTNEANKQITENESKETERNPTDTANDENKKGEVPEHPASEDQKAPVENDSTSGEPSP